LDLLAKLHTHQIAQTALAATGHATDLVKLMLPADVQQLADCIANVY
jgi:hypothetical protein